MCTRAGQKRLFQKCMHFCLYLEPALYFGNTEYRVDESAGYVEIHVWRAGTDLSKAASVTVCCKKTEPVSAEGELLIKISLRLL